MLAEDGDREDGEPRHALERRSEELRWPDWRAERVESENKLSELARETESNVSGFPLLLYSTLLTSDCPADLPRGLKCTSVHSLCLIACSDAVRSRYDSPTSQVPSSTPITTPRERGSLDSRRQAKMSNSASSTEPSTPAEPIMRLGEPRSLGTTSSGS